MIKVPEKCLCCGALVSGGSDYPGKEFTLRVDNRFGPEPRSGRVFYACGASMSVKGLGSGAYSILFKNCCCDECRSKDC